MSLFWNKNKYPIVLVLTILLCLWPFSFFVFIPKWDNINGYLPYRYFISDYIWNGHLPLWNPFQRLGYPGYSDLQSGCWSPIMWIIMLFGKYTIGSLIVELLSYFVIAGLGMYTLGNYFYKNPKTSFIIGLCYALSGFMVGSTQLMVFLIGVAWLPWCIYGLLNFLTSFKIKYAVLTSLFIALCASAVSPAYTIVLAYIFIFIFLYFLWKNRGEYENIKKILNGGVIILVISILLLLPYLNSFIEFAPYFNRIDKLAYDGLLSNPFILADYISFLFPYTVISSTDIFNQTDLTLRNGYFGIVGFIFFIAAIFTVKNKYHKILLVVFISSLVLAAGSETFIYKWIYNLPGFGVFRHPSFFRTYTIFSALLLAGFALKKTIVANKLSKIDIKLILGFIVVLIAVAVGSFFNTSIRAIIENLSNVFYHQEISTHSIYTHLFINSSVLLLLTLICFCLKKVFKLSLFITIAIFVVLDLGIQTRLTAPATMYYNISYNDVAQYFDELPNDINQNDNNKPLKQLDETQGLKSTKGIWQNVSTFNKTISCVGINPMRFRTFDEAEENGTLDKIIENPILFFQESEGTKINSTVIGYNEFKANVNNNSNQIQLFLLNQNYHAQWKAYYNGSPLPVEKANKMIMKVEIPAKSKGEIQFVFESPRTVYTFIISFLTYLLITIYLIKISFFRKTVIVE